MKSNIHFYRQYDTNDCAPTCLRMICSYYQNRYSMDTLRNICGVSKIGVTVRDIVKGLESLGFQAMAIKVSSSKLNTMPLPAILYWEQQHFVILYNIFTSRNGIVKYRIANPSFGKTSVDEKELKTAFAENNGEGIAIILEPTPQFYEMKDEKQEFKTWGLLKEFVISSFCKYKKHLSFSFLFTVVALISNWAIPVLFQKLIDDGIGGKDMRTIYLLMIAQFVLFFSYTISSYISNLFLTKSNFSVGIELASKYLLKLTKLPIRFFDTKANSDLIQLMEDQNVLKSFLTSSLPSILLAVCNLIVFSFILLYYNKWIFLVSLFFSLISFLWYYSFLQKQKILEYRNFALESEGKSKIYELIMGMKEIKMNSAQERKIKGFEQNLDKTNKVYLDKLHLDFYINSGLSSLSKIKDILIVLFCASFIIEGQMSVGGMLAITYLLGQVSTPLLQIFQFGTSLQMTKISMDRLRNIQEIPDENDSVKVELPMHIYNGIKLENASFKYVGDFPYVLKNISCNIPKGKVTAIVGTSGGGKTTLLKLLVGFYYPQQGKLLLDNIPMCDLDAELWRKRCGVVMQDGYLFSGTLLDNIAISEENPCLEKVVKAAQIACIDDFISKLPMGYYTQVGNTGIELSGGQKQRILIARAVYKDPEFIFFDEATSFLDVKNEKQIMNNLNDFFVGKTVIIIAHRLSTVKNADNIIYVENGQVEEQGTYQELKAIHGKYYQLIKEQLIVE